MMILDLFLYFLNCFQFGGNIDVSFLLLVDDRERDFFDDILVNLLILLMCFGSLMLEFLFVGDMFYMGLCRGLMIVIKCFNF